MRARAVLRLFGRSFKGLLDDRVPMMGAALAYYALFAIAPLLLAAILAASVLLGQRAGPEIYDTIQQYVGPNGAAMIRSMVGAAAGRTRAPLVPEVLALVALALGALGVFQQLQDSLDIIWKVEPAPGTSYWRTLGRRLLSFLVLGVICLLLLVSFLVSAAIPLSATLEGAPGGHEIWIAVDSAVSWVIVSALFSAVLRLLPDVKLVWRDVLLGGAFTGLLFVAGKQFIGIYLARSGVSSAYGAAGSIVVILLWIYYSSEIFLFGAEFTRAWVTEGGRWPEPKRGARKTGPGLDGTDLGSGLD